MLSPGQKLAALAFRHTAEYDVAVATWMGFTLAPEDGDAPAFLPPWFGRTWRRTSQLRYGENPHQQAALYSDDVGWPGLAQAEQLHGKEMSYNNFTDADAAWRAAFDHQQICVAIIKHANPCGIAISSVSVADAHRKAHECDPLSAFGGVIAANTEVTVEMAEFVSEIFTEVIIAPDADDDARRILAAKKNLRLLIAGGLPDPTTAGLTFKSVSGGLLVQSRDNGRIGRQELKIVTKRQPIEAEIADMLFAFTVGKHVKSNTIVFARNLTTAGIGAGQMSRVDSARIAAEKARAAAKAAGWPEPMTKGSAAASDAYFPFPDGLLEIAHAGATSVIQPGGSIHDKDVIAAADEVGVTMAFTGMRHFRH